MAQTADHLLVIGRSRIIADVSTDEFAAIGHTAAAHTITLLELAIRSATLEEAFFDLTRDETDYRAGQLAGSSKGI